MNSPYAELGGRSFWRTGAAERHPSDTADLYIKKFDIRPDDRIVTAGSCFAQHITGQLRARGFRVLDTEMPPADLDPEIAKTFGFNLYSARYGNIYTVRQMLQLIQECSGERTPEDYVWKRKNRYFDALRPSVEPNGLPSPRAVALHREQHRARVRQLLGQIDLFVFTLGLTEAWVNLGDGTVYPTAPGTIAGAYNTGGYWFKNFSYTDVLEDFLALRDRLRGYNPNMRFLLTVSPVPLTATAGPEHVLAATTYSKSVLRAVAGYLALSFPDIDYFPAYEIIAGTPTRGAFYDGNLRTVTQAGVDVVMRCFFEQHAPAAAGATAPPQDLTPTAAGLAERTAAQRAICEEELLEAFAR